MNDDKFGGKYRNGSARLSYREYNNNAKYYITINTFDKRSYFGFISDAKMKISDSGLIADTIWREIENQFYFIKLYEFVIMPNHIHGILQVEKKWPRHVQPGTSHGGCTGKSNPMLTNNISTVIRWYKGRTTFEIRKLYPDFKWQPLFYDRIIRNEAIYRRKKQYILENPLKWWNKISGEQKDLI